jgi:hydrogenase-4 transcriptional activator
VPTSDLLLQVWREACLHLELNDSVGRIARIVADHAAADLLVIRQVDVTRSALETVAVGACRADAAASIHARTECQGAIMRELVAWCRGNAIIGGPVPSSNTLLQTLTPLEYRGECLAAPIHSDDGPAGALLLLSRTVAFGDVERRLLHQLKEPLGVALANTARVHELKRLREALEADKQALLNKLGRHDVAEAVVGAETGLRAVMDQVEHVAGTDVPVLIIGETGSGKEVLARALHERSRRARAPIVRVNCGAIPAGLVDSELFGHERGSFTGAIATRHGWFERADGGTLFLDEIGELPLEAQVRLLRILQDGTFERVGGQRPLSVDVRIVAATHRDLREMVARGSFREDLWYRISVFPIQLPPLRERREDIPGLAAHFAARAATRLVGVPLTPTPEDLNLLLGYDWPGNVRELAAVIERAAILGAGRTLRIGAALGVAASAAAPPAIAPPKGSASNVATETLDEAMRRHIERALRASGGRVEGSDGAARLLRINPHTLRARMRKLRIPWATFRGKAIGAADGAISSLDEAMAAHISHVLEQTHGRVEGAQGAAKRLAINPHTLRARMRKLGIVVSAHRQAADKRRS